MFPPPTPKFGHAFCNPIFVLFIHHPHHRLDSRCVVYNNTYSCGCLPAFSPIPVASFQFLNKVPFRIFTD
jgi:hypothetical protein